MLRHIFRLLFVLTISWSCDDHPQVDLIIYNGKIYTVDSGFTVVNAMAVKDGKVFETGTLDHIRRTYRAPKNIDLEGKAVYPGFNDAHSHFMGYANTLRWVNLVGVKSYDEAIKRCKDFQKKHGLTFVIGRGWDQNDWGMEGFPDKAKLDKVFPFLPVYLYRIDGHAALVNQATLNFAGIDTSTTINGGIIEKDAEGNLTGILVDNAMGLVDLPSLPNEDMLEALKEAEKNIFKAGLTTVTDAGLERSQIELIDSLQQAGEMKLRVYAMVSDKPYLQEHYLKNGPIQTDHLNVSSFKFYLDGALGSRGALMLKPYSDDSSKVGLQVSPYSHYVESAKKLKENGWQMCVHAIGDSANRLVLNVYEEVLEGKKDHRWRIEHAQIVAPEDVARFGKLGVIPSVQPTHATSDMYWAEDRLGWERMVEAYPCQSLLNSAGILPLGTDFPVEDIDPLRTFYSAVFRQDTAGFPEGGFTAKEVLSREDALRGMTIWPAYAAFEENEKGSLEVGKWADFVILDQDILTAPKPKIPDTKVLMTFVGGEKVFEVKKPSHN
ncbi:amidohydrolase [Owenweeksia hongkongensis]|uniref:amidohydrolase n=1 Tax=Owenweeksia hongkongensis TaxID=253245 RepID=UPI003A8D782E